jgi:hypothetical protein
MQPAASRENEPFPLLPTESNASKAKTPNWVMG